MPLALSEPGDERHAMEQHSRQLPEPRAGRCGLVASSHGHRQSDAVSPDDVPDL